MTKRKQFAVGVDLGGTFVKAALVSNTGKILFKDKLPIGPEASKENILDTIENIIRNIIEKAGENDFPLSGIGIGTPGIVKDGVVLGGSENLDGWENLDLSGYFNRIFKMPVSVDNDANLMGLGELYYGAAKDSSDVVFLTIGTGIGGAVIINGELYGGHENRGTELGHVVVEHNGPNCNCGGRGCLELYSSTSALIRNYSKRSGISIEKLNGHFIIKKFKENEENAVRSLKEHTDYLGHGVASFINIFSPQKVVIGGGISESGHFYIDMIKEYAFGYMMPDCGKNTEIVGAQLGNDAGSLGAAALILKKK